MLDNDKINTNMKSFSKYFVSIFGIGFIPYASGTLGSLFTIIIWYILLNYNIYAFYILFIIIFIISFKITDVYLNKNSELDPPEVVIDEFIGQSIPLLFIFEFDIYEILLAFSAFRFFDIYKIYPINKAEKMSGSYGIIMDDVIAGIYTLIVIMLYKILFIL